MASTSFSISTVLGVVEFGLQRYNRIVGEKDRRPGGYLCIRNNDTGRIRLVSLVGNDSINKPNKRFEFSLEKGLRLLEKNKSLGHLSSWQSRDEATEKYPGAIIAGDYVLSFSGLPPLGDEALMLRIGVQLGLLDRDAAKAIAKISDNLLFDEMAF